MERPGFGFSGRNRGQGTGNLPPVPCSGVLVAVVVAPTIFVAVEGMRDLANHADHFPVVRV